MQNPVRFHHNIDRTMHREKRYSRDPDEDRVRMQQAEKCSRKFPVIADRFFDDMRKAGMNIVRTTDDIVI